MNLLSWIVFGALAGWVASIIAGTSRKQGCLTDIIVGVVGAFIGGVIMNFVTKGDWMGAQWNIESFVVAVLGAVVLLVLTGANRRRR